MVVLYVYVTWDDFQGNAHKALVSIKDAALGEDRYACAVRMMCCFLTTRSRRIVPSL
jgi:hypothetical protein